MPDQPTDHAGLETLPFDVCLRLLASVPIGRLGFYADGEVVLLPVNHAVDGQDVVFRTASGSKLTAAEEQDLVAFEADDYDLRTRSGWSVLVTGRAMVVYDEAEASRWLEASVAARQTSDRRPPELSTRDNVARAIYTEVKEGRVLLSWDDVPGAVTYTVRRSEKKGGP